MVGTRICYANIWIFPLPFATLSGKMVVQQRLRAKKLSQQEILRHTGPGEKYVSHRRSNRHEETTAPHPDDPGIGMRAAHMGSCCYIGGCNKSPAHHRRRVGDGFAGENKSGKRWRNDNIEFQYGDR